MSKAKEEFRVKFEVSVKWDDILRAAKFAADEKQLTERSKEKVLYELLHKTSMKVALEGVFKEFLSLTGKGTFLDLRHAIEVKLLSIKEKERR